jgi:hypothetical protein
MLCAMADMLCAFADLLCVDLNAPDYLYFERGISVIYPDLFL